MEKAYRFLRKDTKEITQPQSNKKRSAIVDTPFFNVYISHTMANNVPKTVIRAMISP